MEKTGYFRSINQFNLFTDIAAGNFLPLSDKKTTLSFGKFLWMICTLSIKLLYLITVSVGTLYFANLSAEEAFQKFGAMASLGIELLVPTIYLNLSRDKFRKLIEIYNLILIDSDVLRRYTHDSVKRYNKGLKFYMFAGLVASFFFSMAAMLKVVAKDSFTYADFTVPAYLPGEPFGKTTFVVGVIFQIFGSCFVHVGIVSLYIYIVHYISLLVGQYKYLRGQMAEALSEKNGETGELTVITALQKCILHHCAVIKVGQTLVELLALYVGTTYILCILEFCFLAFGIITLKSALVEKCAYIQYIFCRMVLVFMLCSCVQELLDTSTSVMDDAFHENWYARSRKVRKIFHTIQLGNQKECRISAYGIVDLVVPTLALMMSKSYSVCLLLLNVK